MLVDAIRANPDGLQVASAHPQGGNRMGEDPNNVSGRFKLQSAMDMKTCTCVTQVFFPHLLE